MNYGAVVNESLRHSHVSTTQRKKPLYENQPARNTLFYTQTGIPDLWRQDDWLKAGVLAETTI